jgi:N-acetylmuramoyl-L-alanine amidase
MSDEAGLGGTRVMGRPRPARPTGVGNADDGATTAPVESGAGGAAAPGIDAHGSLGEAANGPAGAPVTAATPFRAIGDVPLAVWEGEAAKRGSPIDDLAACAAASRGFGALALAQAIRETSLGRAGTDRRNALGLMGPDGRTPLRFARWADGFASYRRRLADPTYKGGVYQPADLALADFVAIYVGGPGCRASGLERCANGETRASVTRYLDDVARLIGGWRGASANRPVAGPEPPAIVDRVLPPGLNTAWDDLGPRTIRGVCLHRMLGTLDGTDAWFRGGARASARTDFGIGDGRIFQWTPLAGRMAPWASGPANDVEGDGVAFVRRYGVAAVNRDLVSVELAGWYDTPVPAADWARLVELVAWIAAA